MRQRAWFKAGRVLDAVRKAEPGSDAAREAGERLHALPSVANLDKWSWGEAYASGDYFGRYDTVVGSGFIRQGTFIPEARWLQPYAEYLFSVDTGSQVSRSGRGQTILFDNAVGFYGGVRLQVLPTEYLFLYGQGGVNKDLLEQRENGDWALDYQAGLYGFKSWGPGVVFQNGATPGPSGATPPDGGWFWRGDWFTDAGGNFSYYHRYRSGIGYEQMHKGFRLAQWGANVAFDGYIIENVAWDVRGDYFDNFTDFGPGARAIWRPHPNWQVVLTCEWLQGFYFGRDGQGNRNGAAGDYHGVHVGLSVGARW